MHIKDKTISAYTDLHIIKYFTWFLVTDLENTWISSCSLQDGPRLATNKVAHGVVFCGMYGVEHFFCQHEKRNAGLKMIYTIYSLKFSRHEKEKKT